MATTAFQTQYRQEFIAGFEQGMTLLSAAVTREAMIKGNQATFLVADTGGATAVTRGVNGLIPARQDNLNQFTATLTEWHDLVQRTSFNIFASQGDGRRIMQAGVQKVLNRKMDQDILTTLANATLHAGTTTTATLSLVMRARTILGNNLVDITDQENMFFVISPAFEAYLLQVKEFASTDWVQIQPLVGPAKRYRQWAGFNWIVHNMLTGAGTSSEQCYAFHRNAIGQAVNTGEMQLLAGYMEEQDYSFSRATAYLGSKVLQTSGIVQVLHDGSAFVAT